MLRERLMHDVKLVVIGKYDFGNLRQLKVTFLAFSAGQQSEAKKEEVSAQG